MGIFNYGGFKGASRPETPGFALAAARQGQLDSAEQARIASLRSQNVIGGAELYNAGMGDRTPLADSIFGAEAEVGAEATQSMAPQTPYEAMLGGTEAGAVEAGVGGATEAAIPVVESLAAPAAALEAGAAAPVIAETVAGGAGAAGLAGGLGTAAMTALPPAALAYALYSMFA